MTSDSFFKQNEEKFDCIFIDGLHRYHQVKKDILNSIDALNEGGIILLHDCLPNNVYEQAIPRCQYKWNGDVWKAIVECRTNENIDTYTCFADYGIGVILNRKNKNILQLNDVMVKGCSKSNKMYLTVTNKQNDTSNDYSVELAEGVGEPFKMYFKSENLKIVGGDYIVSISEKGISHFKNTNNSLEYWIALEPDSTYGS